MSRTFDLVRALVSRRDVKISDHGYDELVADGLFVRDVLDGVADGVVVEDYSDYPKGPCVLVLPRGSQGDPIHVVWGIPRGANAPVVMVTAYRPSLDRWMEGFLKRRM